MKSKFFTTVMTACIAVMLSFPVLAQEDALKEFPGYVDFGELNTMFGDPKVQISVGQSLLGLVASLSAEEDPEAAALFNRLFGVRVNVFETEAMPDGAIERIKDVSSRLSKLGWESVVTVNSDEEQVRVFMMINNNQVEGITVMALEEDEAVFVNVIGNINPEELSRVMKNFDINVNDIEIN